VRTRNQVWGVRVIDTRERLLDAEKLIDVGAIDRYDFVRNAYLQRRRNLVYDGNPPPEEEDEEPAKKPRSEAAPPLMTVLVDQFGNTIAGGEPVTGGIVPLLVESTSKAPPPQVENVQRVPTSAPREQSLAPAAAEPRPIAEAVQTVQSSNAPEATAPSRNGHAVVKVWLPTQPR
jgi:hypothetical protein